MLRPVCDGLRAGLLPGQRRLRWRAREPKSWGGRGLLGVFAFHVAFSLVPSLIDLVVVLSAGLLVGDVLTLLDPAVYLVRVLAHEFLGLVDKALEVWHGVYPRIARNDFVTNGKASLVRRQPGSPTPRA